MKIAIIGLGVVGLAVKKGFEYIGHEVVGYDIKDPSTTMQDLIHAKIAYICVGTPSTPEGYCNIEAVLDVVYQLNALHYKGIVTIKSTVAIGTTNRLQEKYPNLSFAFVPEFLRERCAYEDFVENNHVLVVGTDDDSVYNTIVESHGKLPTQKVQVKPVEAELIKYYSNTYKAMKITFANSFHRIAEHFEADYNVVKNGFLSHGVKEGDYLEVNEHFAGYGGMCLPKDTKAMKALVNDYKLDLKVFDFLDTENNKFVTKVPKGMRKEA